MLNSLETLLSDSTSLELTPALTEIKRQHANVEKWAKPEKPPFSVTWTPFRPTVAKEPKGTVLIINPFNYPVWLNLVQLVSILPSETRATYLSGCVKAGAIAAGCTVLLKPSEQTPACSSLLAETLHKYLDGDIVRVVNGAIPETTRVGDCSFSLIMLLTPHITRCWNCNGTIVSIHFVSSQFGILNRSCFEF
jgi:aldehyde dehydrogenase (NAD+)